MLFDQIKALLFDVGGTLIDWHSGLIRQLEQLGEKKGIKVDWAEFANFWRSNALEMALDSKTQDLPAGSIDGVHRHVLDKALSRFDIHGIGDPEKDAMTLYWHKCPSWPDAPRGHARLRKKYLLGTLTILSLPMVVRVSRTAPFYWDCIITCQMLEWYKFHAPVYESGPRLLGLRPEQVMMVAAHNLDLAAAQKAGMRTALVSRPQEWGRKGSIIDAPDHIEFENDGAGKDTMKFDVQARNLLDLADKLGV